MSKQKDKEIIEIGLFVFAILVSILSFVLTLLTMYLFPKLPWEEIGRLTIYGIGSLFLMIYGIIVFAREFQKGMIGLQVLTGVILFIFYFIVLAILKVHHILKLPSNTWAYIGIYFIFVPFILYPTLKLEYKFFIKKYLKKRKERLKETDSKEEEEQDVNQDLEQTQ